MRLEDVYCLLRLTFFLRIKALFLMNSLCIFVVLTFTDFGRTTEQCIVKIEHCEKATKFGPSSTHHLTLISNFNQKVEDGPNFCGVLRISELYHSIKIGEGKRLRNLCQPNILGSLLKIVFLSI